MVATGPGTGSRRLGSRLRAERERAGLTQAALAKGVASAAYISRIEAGQRHPSAALLQALGARLGVEPASLTSLEEVSGATALQVARAEWLLARGQARAALDLATSARAELPAAADAELESRSRHVLARALLAAHRPDSALDLLERRPDVELGAVELTTLARCHLQAGDAPPAVEAAARGMQLVLSCALIALPPAREVAAILGRALTAAGREDEAARTRSWVLTIGGPVAASEADRALTLAGHYLAAGVAHHERGLSIHARRLADRAHHHLDVHRADVVWQAALTSTDEGTLDA